MPRRTSAQFAMPAQRAILLGGLLLAGCATRPGIGETDVRTRADVRVAPWQSIGLVRTDAGARCTGALVGPRTVMTAAHCLYDPRTLKPVAAGAVHFILPRASQPLAERGRAVAYLMGQGFAMAPGGRPSAEARADADWALLSMDVDMGRPDRLLPLAPGLAVPGMKLAYGGYQADQPTMLLADFDCRVLGYGRDPAGSVMMLHSCAGTQGASGGPLLGLTPEGAWVVVAIGSLARNADAGGFAVPAVTVARAAAAQATARLQATPAAQRN